MNHLDVLEKIKNKLKNDPNIISFLVFGSVADGSYRKDSDIDTTVVYKNFPKGYEFSTEQVDDIKVGFSRWSLEELERNVRSVPYLMYIFSNAKLILDKKSNIGKLQNRVRECFKMNKEAEKEWKKYLDRYEDEKKKYGSGKTPISRILDALEKKFSGGKIRRTFLT